MVWYSAEKNVSPCNVNVTLTSERMYFCTLIYVMSKILLDTFVYNWEVI